MFNEFILKDFKNSATQLQSIIDDNKKELKELLNIKNKSYQNFVVPYQLMSENLEVFCTPIFHINSVQNSEISQKVYAECLPLLTLYSTKLGQNEELFNAIKFIKEKEYPSLHIEQKKVLDNEIRDFSLSGCGLDKKKKERLEELNLKLRKDNNI